MNESVRQRETEKSENKLRHEEKKTREVMDRREEPRVTLLRFQGKR